MDLYEALSVIGMTRGLVRTLGDEESVGRVIKALRLSQAQVLHPDKRAGDEKKMVRLNQAYEALKEDGAMSFLLQDIRKSTQYEKEIDAEYGRLQAAKARTAALNDRIATFLVDLATPMPPSKGREIVLHDQVRENLRDTFGRSSRGQHTKLSRTVTVGEDRSIEGAPTRTYVVGSLPSAFTLANDSPGREATNGLLGLEKPVSGQRTGYLRRDDFAQVVHALDREIAVGRWLVTFEVRQSESTKHAVARKTDNAFFKLEGVVRRIKEL